MNGLQARDLHKTYGQTAVLTGVDFSFEAGEYIVLVGPSGCGKSTLLRCIAGLETITRGDLLLGGRRVNDVPPRDRDVGMVFQSYALYPHMTVRENMAFSLTIRNRPPAEIDAAVREASAMLELDKLLDRYPAELSGGQRQRVAMGRAVVRRPATFLFDEPLSNLDPALRSHMRVELKRLHRRLGATIVHVTHDQIEAMTLADRIVVLHGGRVQQVGSPAELFERPANTFVARFIGAPPMNLVPADAAALAALGDLAPRAALPPGSQLGVRPTDLLLDADGPWEVVVDVVERLGHEALLHVQLGALALTVHALEPCAHQSGDRLRIRPTRVHAFDAEGRRIEAA